MSTHEPAREVIADADEASLDGVRARLTQGYHPIAGLLQRLSGESLDDLSAELTSLDASDMAEFIAALDTLDRLSTRLKPTEPRGEAGSVLESRPIKAQVAVTEFADVMINEMAAMLVELMSTFESSPEYDAVTNTNWCSPGGRCEVSKSGQSAALLWSLQQDPEAVFAEYRIRLDGHEVWSWSDKVWPDLSMEVAVAASVRIPTLCHQAITHYLEQHSAEWVERWRKANQAPESSNHTSV